MARPDAIISPCSKDAIRRRGRSIRICRIFHRRTPILHPLCTHEVLVRMLLRAPRRRQQIYKKRKDVKGKQQCYYPFKDCSNVLLAVESGGDEDDSEDDLHDDEGEFEPEGEAQDAVLAEVHAEALVLCADEDSADDVAGHEEKEEAVVQAGVVERVKDGEEDETAGSRDGEDDCAVIDRVSKADGIAQMCRSA